MFQRNKNCFETIGREIGFTQVDLFLEGILERYIPRARVIRNTSYRYRVIRVQDRKPFRKMNLFVNLYPPFPVISFINHPPIADEST